jgi:hypothetical protein
MTYSSLNSFGKHIFVVEFLILENERRHRIVWVFNSVCPRNLCSSEENKNVEIHSFEYVH